MKKTEWNKHFVSFGHPKCLFTFSHLHPPKAPFCIISPFTFISFISSSLSSTNAFAFTLRIEFKMSLSSEIPCFCPSKFGEFILQKALGKSAICFTFNPIINRVLPLDSHMIQVNILNNCFKSIEMNFSLSFNAILSHFSDENYTSGFDFDSHSQIILLNTPIICFTGNLRLQFPPLLQG